jgi:hypothetical protein
VTETAATRARKPCRRKRRFCSDECFFWKNCFGRMFFLKNCLKNCLAKKTVSRARRVSTFCMFVSTFCTVEKTCPSLHDSTRKLLGSFDAVIRVARWFSFVPKTPIWVYFGGTWNGKCWYILWPFGIFQMAIYLVYFMAACIVCVYLVSFPQFGMSEPRKIWQPWL